MPSAEIAIAVDWGYAHGSPGANVFHCRDQLGSESFHDQADWLHTFFDAIKGLYNSTTTLRFLGDISGIGDDAGNLYTADPWTVTGTDTGSVAPAVLQMLTQWRAETGGRRGRGRTYIGPLGAGTVESNGTPAEGSRTVLLDAANDLIDTSTASANGAMCVYSRVDGILRDIVGVTVPNDFAILRSRRD